MYNTRCDIYKPFLSYQRTHRIFSVRATLLTMHVPVSLFSFNQPLQLSTIKCAGGSSATRDRGKRPRPDTPTQDKDATLFRVGPT